MKRYMIDRFGHSIVSPHSLRNGSENAYTGRRTSEQEVDRNYLQRYYMTKVDDDKKLLETRDYVDKNFITKIDHERNIQETQDFVQQNYINKIDNENKLMETLNFVEKTYITKSEHDNKLQETKSDTAKYYITKVDSEKNMVETRDYVQQRYVTKSDHGKKLKETMNDIAKMYITKVENEKAIEEKMKYIDKTYLNKREYGKEMERMRNQMEHNYITKSEHILLENNLMKKINKYIDETLATCMRINEDRTGWDGKNLKIQNVKRGEVLSDVSVLEQTCTFDSNVLNFKCGNRYFNLVENSANEPLVYFTTDSHGRQIFAAYGTDKHEVIPTTGLKWDQVERKLYDYKLREVVWNHYDYHFQYVIDKGSTHMPHLVDKVSNDEPYYNCKNLRLKNLADGIEPTDACTLRQVLIYDSVKKVFKCGDKEFNLTINDDGSESVMMRKNGGPKLVTYKSHKRIMMEDNFLVLRDM